MNIQIIEGIEGARQARDIAVVIDVLRAATVSAYLLDAGVSSIIPVSTAEEAFAYRRAYPEVVLVGEDRGTQLPGFDIGNSPSEIRKRNNLVGSQVVHRSSSGTQGIVNAKNAQYTIFGSFVTAGAILDHLLLQSGRDIALIPMYAPEDHLCAEYLRDNLIGTKSLTMNEIKERVAQREWVKESFFNKDNDIFPEDDFHMCLDANVFDFFPVVREEKIIKSTQI